jgi:hypothetical protein
MSEKDWAPERIWLQRGVGEEGSHTWCEDSITEDSIGEPIEQAEYVRVDAHQTGDHMTDEKVNSIRQNGYKVSGVVMINEHGDRCIVELGAVRWINQEAMWLLMHPGYSIGAVTEADKT